MKLVTVTVTLKVADKVTPEQVKEVMESVMGDETTMLIFQDSYEMKLGVMRGGDLFKVEVAQR